MRRKEGWRELPEKAPEYCVCANSLCCVGSGRRYDRWLLVCLVLPPFMAMTTLRVVPLSLKTANDAVLQWHRHHKPTTGHKWSLGCISGGVLVGVAIAGRPVARMLDNGMTLEVNRLATDGTPNACSFLYGACKRVAREMGYERILTYILATEPGTSLRAAGWVKSTMPRLDAWDRPGRPRTDAPHSEIAKVRWDCWLVPEALRVGRNRPVFGSDEAVAA